MARIDDLINEIGDERVRKAISAEVKKLRDNKKFGLVFENHLPELSYLYSVPVKRGANVVKRGSKGAEVYRVQSLAGDEAVIRRDIEGVTETETVNWQELVAVKRYGEAIYPALLPVETVTKNKTKPYHTLINSDNYHALQLLLYCYEGKFDVIYIDPPYNTGARDWKYNNDYIDKVDAWRHSKWLSMMKKRLILAMRLLSPTGIMCITIDDYEIHRLKALIEDHIPQSEIIGTAVIKNSPSGRPTVRGFRTNHEYAVFIAKDKSAELGRLDKSEEQLSLYKETDEKGVFQWANLRKRGGANTMRTARPKQFYPIYVSGEKIRIPKMEWIKEKRDWNIIESSNKEEEIVYPIGEDGKERIWSLGNDTARKQIENLKVKRRNGRTYIFRKQWLENSGSLPSTWWDDAKYSVIEHGTVLIEKILGSSQAFPFPKSLYAVFDCLRVAGAFKEDALILDFFAGSGTTLHATCLLNAEDEGNRRCVLVTNNEVGETKSKQLNREGFYLGEKEFEKHGIAESVTFPRNKFLINGKRDDGTPLSGKYLNGRELAKGFDENLAFFKLGFLDPNQVALKTQFESVLPILWLMAGAKGKLELTDNKRPFFIPENSPFAVLLKESHFAEFNQAIADREDLTHVFLVTDSEDAFRQMSEEIKASGETVMLYKNYLDNFRLNTERDV